jgi:uncharacterized protein YndB with AHSA1/START domain
MKNAEALKVAPRGDREIVVTQTLGAPRELVFDALNKPELLRRWMYDRMAAPYSALPRLR